MYQCQKEFNQIQINNLEQLYKSHGIGYLTYFDAEYPDLLREIYNPPLILFYKGNIKLLTQKHWLSSALEMQIIMVGKY